MQTSAPAQQNGAGLDGRTYSPARKQPSELGANVEPQQPSHGARRSHGHGENGSLPSLRSENWLGHSVLHTLTAQRTTRPGDAAPDFPQKGHQK
eukprot:4967040-Lingulodinium_polyedra.AAC.1